MLAMAFPAQSATFKRAYLDSQNKVHVVTGAGKDIVLNSHGKPRTLKLSPDGETVAWDVDNGWKPDDEDVRPSKLYIHRKGVTRSIECEVFIRDHWFYKRGRFIGVDCGGLHFAGRETLYNIDTLKAVGTFHQADVPLEKRPPWASE